MTITIGCIIAICVAAAIGAVIGIFKKATGLSFWGVNALLSVLIAQLAAKLIPLDNGLYSWLILGITVGSALLLMGIFGLLKRFLEKRIKNAREYSHYKNSDRLEENEAHIMNAVDSKNKRQYRKLRRKRRKIKDSARGWGFIDRLLGMIVSGADWLVAVGSIMSVLLLFVEFSGIDALQHAYILELLASPGWVNFGSKFALDVMLVGTIIITIKSGFKKGISHIVTPVVVLGLLAGFGYASWAIASSSACSGIVTSLENGMLSQLGELEASIGIEEAIGFKLTTIVAMVIITAVIFILTLPLVILTGVMLPKLIDKYRDNDAFYVIDGIIGCVVATALLLAVFMVFGGIAYTLADLEFMAKFNSYEMKSIFADTFYSYNPFGYLFRNLPIRNWFGS